MINLKNIETLTNSNILIVEDEPMVATSIAKVFKEYTKVEPTIAHCIDQAFDVIGEKNKFDLIVLDVMLAQTNQDYEEILEHDRKINDLVLEIEDLYSNFSGAKLIMQLDLLRRQKNIEEEELREHINFRGGVELVKKLIKKTNGKELRILFLSGLGDEKVIHEALSMGGCLSRWLIKPVDSEEILDKAIDLLTKNKPSRGK